MRVKPPIEQGVVVVTGASSGIGRELARQLAASARVLVLVARRADRLEALRAELARAHPALELDVRSADLGDRGQTLALADALVARYGAVDVLVNNAGLGDVGLFERADLAKLEQLVAVNVSALVALTHRLLGPMLARGRGGVLNVSSGWGLTWAPGMGVYVASKHFVTAFTECLRAELRGTGVVVSQLCPGPVPTEFEAVAGNPTGQRVPAVLEVTAAHCARVGLRGFRKGRAMILPGFVIRTLTRLGAATPRFVLRLLYRGIGPYLRRRAAAP